LIYKEFFDKNFHQNPDHLQLITKISAFFPPASPCLTLDNRIRKCILSPMPELVRVEPIALLPTQGGCAVFLGDGNKAIMFYIDPSVGASINASLTGQMPSRPLTHDLISMAFQAFGAKISRAIIVKVDGDVYYARLILEAENEIMERKIIELDARPSDCIALSVRNGAPLYVVKKLWETLEDMTAVLAEMRLTGQNGQDGTLDLGIL
jgi:uncharacterized protein